MAKDEQGFMDWLAEDICNTIEIKGAIEATRDENGKVDKWAATGLAIGLGHTSDDEMATLVGFPEKTADIRMAQYESGTRTPKDDLTKALADVLDVSPLALSVPDIDSQLGLMHTLFALEDLYGLKINIADGEVTLRFDVSNVSDPSFFEMVTAWAEQAAKYKSGEISKEDYDKWRYRFPEFDNTQIWAKVPSKELSDALVDAFKDKLKD